jgi:hypothetical protein
MRDARAAGISDASSAAAMRIIATPIVGSASGMRTVDAEAGRVCGAGVPPLPRVGPATIAAIQAQVRCAGAQCPATVLAGS